MQNVQDPDLNCCIKRLWFNCFVNRRKIYIVQPVMSYIHHNVGVSKLCYAECSGVWGRQDGDSMFLRNTYSYLPEYPTSYPRDSSRYSDRCENIQSHAKHFCTCPFTLPSTILLLYLLCYIFLSYFLILSPYSYLPVFLPFFLTSLFLSFNRSLSLSFLHYLIYFFRC
jgi:hypothetical protein